MQVRDIFEQKDLGIFESLVSLEVPPMDAIILKLTPILDSDVKISIDPQGTQTVLQ